MSPRVLRNTRAPVHRATRHFRPIARHVPPAESNLRVSVSCYGDQSTYKLARPTYRKRIIGTILRDRKHCADGICEVFGRGALHQSVGVANPGQFGRASRGNARTVAGQCANLSRRNVSVPIMNLRREPSESKRPRLVRPLRREMTRSTRLTGSCPRDLDNPKHETAPPSVKRLIGHCREEHGIYRRPSA
jgi:hypothetical protein